jgi:hypothetical protein
VTLLPTAPRVPSRRQRSEYRALLIHPAHHLGLGWLDGRNLGAVLIIRSHLDVSVAVDAAATGEPRFRVSFPRFRGRVG